jgi:hypothetical protein
MILHRAGSPILYQSRISRIDRYPSIIENERRDSDIADFFYSIENRIRISQTHKG